MRETGGMGKAAPLGRQRTNILARFDRVPDCLLPSGGASPRARRADRPRHRPIPRLSPPAHAPRASPGPVDERALRDALAQFATGVTIICAHAGEGRYVGFTANSFNSVSLAPPLVLWSLAHRSRSLAAFAGAPHYVVNVLAATQVELARRFSRPHADRFAGVDFALGWAAAPRIAGCVAWLECRHHARLRAGDHDVFIGEVMTCTRGAGEGLVFANHRFASARPLVER
jgi:flavin reductase (DIM6/NTAB) family NADH-FMN oxidoreductase RutF